MKKIVLSQDEDAVVDGEDYNYLNVYKWNGKKSKHTCYARRRDKFNKTIFMHRVITNCPDNMQVDHINHNGLDNRKET